MAKSNSKRRAAVTYPVIRGVPRTSDLAERLRVVERATSGVKTVSSVDSVKATR